MKTMMNYKILVFAALMVVALGCDEKEMKLYPTIEESTIVTVEEKGYFEKDAILKVTDIKQAIADLELEEDGQIESISIEGVWFVVTPLANNTAQKVSLDLLIAGWGGGEMQLLDDLELPVPTKETTIHLHQALKRAGVVELRKQMNAVVTNGVIGGDIKMKLEGTPFPEESMLHLQIEVVVRGTIVFTQTVTMI
jgi:hypothetical protein